MSPNGNGIKPEEVAAWRRMAIDHERVMTTVFGDGNGNEGLLSKINRLLTRDEFEREIRKDKEKKQERRNLIVYGAILTLLGGIVLLLAQLWANGHKIVSAEQPQQHSQVRPQDAGGPEPEHF